MAERSQTTGQEPRLVNRLEVGGRRIQAPTPRVFQVQKASGISREERGWIRISEKVTFGAWPRRRRRPGVRELWITIFQYVGRLRIGLWLVVAVCGRAVSMGVRLMRVGDTLLAEDQRVVMRAVAVVRVDRRRAGHALDRSRPRRSRAARAGWRTSTSPARRSPPARAGPASGSPAPGPAPSAPCPRSSRRRSSGSAAADHPRRRSPPRSRTLPLSSARS